jgi:hypothetical protein
MTRGELAPIASLTLLLAFAQAQTAPDTPVVLNHTSRVARTGVAVGAVPPTASATTRPRYDERMPDMPIAPATSLTRGRRAAHAAYGASGPFGSWTRDEFGLPCFDLVNDESLAPYSDLRHLISTGRLSAFCDRWGNVGLFTTDGGEGFVTITRTANQCRSACYSLLRLPSGGLVSLVPGEWPSQRTTRYGVGYASYAFAATAGATTVRVEVLIAAPGDDSPFLRAHLSLRNVGGGDLDAEWLAAADCSLLDIYHSERQASADGGPGEAVLRQVHPALGDLFLTGPASWRSTALSPVAACLACPVHLAPGAEVEVELCVGYGDAQARERSRTALRDHACTRVMQAWADRLAVLDSVATTDWERDECVWTMGQLLAFTCYDASVGEHYLNLGGYGWQDFNQREVGEMALALAPWFPDQASACVRWMAATQAPSGDLPASHDYRRSTLAQPLPDRVTSSDTELWFLLALCAAARVEPAILDQVVRFRDGTTASLWEHALAAWRWVVERIGVGEHGLVKSWHGDWNDYLWPVGQAGRGESMMNTGMACVAGSALAVLARGRGEHEWAGHTEALVQDLRSAAGRAFACTHFVRGYTDAGKAVGAADRVFVDAQCWAALGECGTAEQRRTALLHTLAHNATELGLCLVNPALPSPPPADVSSLPIPAGEGENGGVWPQVVAWFVWALAAEGQTGQAHALWRRMTLRHHYAAYPDVPFGIWGGPDCYNSHLAGARAHWTQVQLWDRRAHAPMNPAVAWQAFARWQVQQAGRAVVHDGGEADQRPATGAGVVR